MSSRRITDETAPCILCGCNFPVGTMTMNDLEQWECDDVDACADRAGRRPPGTSAGLASGPRRTDPAPSDEQIRAYLDRNPDAFGQFLRREERRDPQWFRKQARILGRWP